MKLSTERQYPIAIGLAVLAVLLCAVHFAHLDMSHSENLLASVTTLGGVLAGFMAAAQTILLGLGEETRARLMDSGYVSHLRRYFTEALWVSLAVCVAALIGFHDSLRFVSDFIAALFALIAYSLACLYRVSTIAINLLTTLE